ncbi:hypothetical protein OH77DRAFT_1431579 [Trametes cingulata]|nr:hypothetical protein OH77DRAFT_1431579 [Trametes cingulata]
MSASVAVTATATATEAAPPPLRLTAMPPPSSPIQAEAGATPQATVGPPQVPESRPAPKRPSRARDVVARDLTQSQHGYEMVYAFLCAIHAHKEIHERAHELHGNINPNALLLLDRLAPDGSGAVEDSEGGLIYWEPPLSVQTLRKIGNPDRAIPPPARRRYFYRY